MLSATDLTLGYGSHILCRHLTLDIQRGECILLCGPNGSGKSTLLRTLAALEDPLEGRMERDAEILLVPTGIPKVKGFSLREFLMTGCYRESRWSGRLSREWQEKTDRALSQLGLSELAEKDLSTLSDGEFQKGCMATALVRDPDMLLLDEPTAFLDVGNRVSLVRILQQLSQEGKTVLVSSHDLADCLPICTRVLGLDGKGRFLDSGPDAPVSRRKAIAKDCFGGVDF